MVSWAGKGSSKPSPIISQLKLFCMGIALKSKVSGPVGCGCGELLSVVKFHRSASPLVASPRLIDGLDKPRFGMDGVSWLT